MSDEVKPISGAASKAARAFLGWTYADTQKKARLSATTLSNLEKDIPVRNAVYEKLHEAFNQAGVFIRSDGSGMDWK